MKNINTKFAETEKSDNLVAFTYREISTVLAGLRQIQQELENDPDTVLEMPHFVDCDPLTVEEIDELCERLIVDFPSKSE